MHPACRLSLALLVLSSAVARGQVPTPADSPLQQVKLPGFRSLIPGRWLKASDVNSGVPLGGLGTGFMELRADGRIYDTRFRMLVRPMKPLPLRISATLGSEAPTTLISSADLPDPAPAPLRYLGHFPFVELDYGKPTAAPVSVWCRAFSPFVRGDAELSNVPAVVFSVRFKNNSASSVPASVRISWLAHTEPGHAVPFEQKPQGDRGLLMRGAEATHALLAAGAGWTSRTTGSNGLEIAGSLAPGVEKTLTLIASWHVAEEVGPGETRYVPGYAARYQDAGAVARAVAVKASDIETRTIEWQEKLYASQAPDWLKDALVNSLHLLTRDTVWYSDGCYLSEQDGKVVDAVGSRMDGSLPLLLFFPKLEVQALKRLAARQSDAGEIPGRLGYEGQLGAPQFGPAQAYASAEFVLLCRRAALFAGDPTLPKELFPSVKRAAEFAMSLDTDSDGLIDSSPLPKSLATLDRYRRDWLWHGVSSYSALLSLAMLRAAEELAKEAGDTEFARKCGQRFESGRLRLEETLWAERHYRLYVDPDGFRQSDSSFIAALTGQAVAWMLNLGDLCDRNRSAVMLHALEQRHGAIAEREVPSGVTPDGKVDESGKPYSAATVPRDVWLYSAAALYTAARAEDESLRKRTLLLAERAYTAMVSSSTLWRQHSYYRAGDLSPAGDPHYFGNLAVWMLLEALDGKSLKAKPAEPGGVPR
jgi:uncharacterized protein (DUF608 family)